jgi:hypothetical protein
MDFFTSQITAQFAMVLETRRVHPHYQHPKLSTSSMKKAIFSLFNLYDNWGGKRLSQLLALFVAIALNPSMLLAGIPDKQRDFLYVGDNGDNTVKRFDAKTGVYQGIFITQNSSLSITGQPIFGPRGLIFNPQGDLLLVNQNAGQAPNGTVLKYDGKTGMFLRALVNSADEGSTVAPRGIVLKKFLFVAGVG